MVFPLGVRSSSRNEATVSLYAVGRRFGLCSSGTPWAAETALKHLVCVQRISVSASSAPFRGAFRQSGRS